MDKLQLGKGNLVGQVEKLRELGAKTNKTLPRHLAADSDSELAEPAA